MGDVHPRADGQHKASHKPSESDFSGAWTPHGPVHWIAPETSSLLPEKPVPKQREPGQGS